MSELAADDCALFLWITMPMLQEAWGVMEAWGFRFPHTQMTDPVPFPTSAKNGFPAPDLRLLPSPFTPILPYFSYFRYFVNRPTVRRISCLISQEVKQNGDLNFFDIYLLNYSGRQT